MCKLHMSVASILYVAPVEGLAMHQPVALEVDREALDLADQMLERTDVMRTILAETLESAEAGDATESGRTVCGSARNPLGPLARRFTSVQLPTCPIGVGGTWHTHITLGQFLNPENSLPDFANVAFGLVDVSIVAGAESSHAVVAAADRGEMVDALEAVLEVEVSSPADVARAVLGGEVDDPPTVRNRLYTRLGDPVVFRESTPHPELAARAREGTFHGTVPTPTAEAVQMSGCTMYPVYHEIGRAGFTGRMERVLEQGRRCQRNVHGVVRSLQASDFSFRQQVLATTLSVTIGNIVERVLFG